MTEKIAKQVPYPVGLKVKEVRWMTTEEKEEEYWSDHNEVPVLVFEDGSIIYPSCDPEGNEGGALFGKCGNDAVYVMPIMVKE